jgi:hypothetical protein
MDEATRKRQPASFFSSTAVVRSFSLHLVSVFMSLRTRTMLLLDSELVSLQRW